MPVVVERHPSPYGELVLRRAGEHYEIISNGVFLMDTRDGRSERLLVSAALRRAGPVPRLLIGGLGVGFSLAEACARPEPVAVTVVEREPAVLAWHRGPLARFSGGAMDDPRVRVVTADIAAWSRTATDRFDAICLDVDNGPGWTVTDGNAGLYEPAGLAALAARLRPGGVLSVWSAAAEPSFEDRLRARFGEVEALEVAHDRGRPDVIYVATGPVRPDPGRSADSRVQNVPQRPVEC